MNSRAASSIVQRHGNRLPSSILFQLSLLLVFSILSLSSGISTTFSTLPDSYRWVSTFTMASESEGLFSSGLGILRAQNKFINKLYPFPRLSLGLAHTNRGSILRELGHRAIQ